MAAAFLIPSLLIMALSVAIHIAVCFYCYKKRRYKPQTRSGGDQNQVPNYEEDIGGNGSGITYDVINNETPPEMKQHLITSSKIHHLIA